MKTLILPLLLLLGSGIATARAQRHDNPQAATASSGDHLRIARMELQMQEMRGQINELAREVYQLKKSLAKYRESSSAPPRPSRKPAAGSGGTHRVRSGDTLSEIAQAHGLNTRQLLALNPGIVPEKLQIGTELRLDRSSSVRGGSAGTPSYTVVKGDTLSEIAAAHGISTASLMAANSAVDPARLRIGRELHLPGAQQTRPRSSPQRPDHAGRDSAIAASSSQKSTSPPRRPHTGRKKLINIKEATRYLSLARENNTSVATLNLLNNVKLSSNQLIASGSQIYIPGP